MRGVAQEVECLLCKNKILRSSPSSTKRKKKKKPKIWVIQILEGKLE
jgi:hypothetical protein